MLGILCKDRRVVAVCPCCLVVDVLQCSEGVWYFLFGLVVIGLKYHAKFRF